MTQQEHLEKIVVKCRSLLANEEIRGAYQRSAFQSTIAAIEFLLAKGEPGELEIEDERLIDAIISAWPKELL